MIFTPLALSGAFRIDIEKREDNRGFFARTFCSEAFAEHGLDNTIMQMNISMSRRQGTLRGMHFQRPPKAEAKVVRCLKGAIFDVLVDLRAGSPTYGKWVSAELTGDNRSMLYIPKGFAHGFQTLTPDTELLYLHTESYSAGHADGLLYSDPRLGIPWPLPVADISDRDTSWPPLNGLEPIAL